MALTDADIIVSGGRGVGGPEGFDIIYRLADKLNGVVGASRVAVDLGWIDFEHQVGQAGATVKPKIYIACGISGATQHIVGMWESDIVIAINIHRYAPSLISPITASWEICLKSFRNCWRNWRNRVFRSQMHRSRIRLRCFLSSRFDLGEAAKPVNPAVVSAFSPVKNGLYLSFFSFYSCSADGSLVR